MDSHNAKRLKLLHPLQKSSDAEHLKEKLTGPDITESRLMPLPRFAFLALPNELRNMVYTVLLDNRTLRTKASNYFLVAFDDICTRIRYRTCISGKLNILRVCRQVYEEAKPFLKVRTQYGPDPQRLLIQDNLKQVDPNT